MVRSFLNGFFRALNHLLQKPQKVIWICLSLVVLNLVIDGTLFRLISLYRDHDEIQAGIATLEKQNSILREQLKRVNDPAFLEREARDRFDLVSEGDLVFVFSEEETPN
jgi:cell division protein FtsB